MAPGNAEGQGSITAAACHVTGLNQVITVSDVGGPVSAGTLHGMIQTNAGGPARRHGAEHTPSHRRSRIPAAVMLPWPSALPRATTEAPVRTEDELPIGMVFSRTRAAAGSGRYPRFWHSR